MSKYQIVKINTLKHQIIIIKKIFIYVEENKNKIFSAIILKIWCQVRNL